MSQSVFSWSKHYYNVLWINILHVLGMMHSLLIFTKTNQYLEVNYVWNVIFTSPAKKNQSTIVIKQLLTFAMFNIKICQYKKVIFTEALGLTDLFINNFFVYLYIVYYNPYMIYFLCLTYCQDIFALWFLFVFKEIWLENFTRIPAITAKCGP